MLVAMVACSHLVLGPDELEPAVIERAVQRKLMSFIRASIFE